MPTTTFPQSQFVPQDAVRGLSDRVASLNTARSAVAPEMTEVQASQARPQSELRTGPELIRASSAFEGECRFTTWRLFLETVAVLAALLATVFLLPWWPVQVLAGLVAGLVQVRLFIFYHDALHGAVFKRSRLAYLLMSAIGFYLGSVRSVWQESHDFHHQHNGKLNGSAIGTFPILNVVSWRKLSWSARLQYRVTRHPLTILIGYVTIIMIGMALAPFQRDMRSHWGGLVAVLGHAAVIALVAWQFGWVIALCAVVLPNAVSMGIGSYLFYTQHNFPAMRVFTRDEWTYTGAALHGSSMFDMSPLMHWFTGNIGFHHVHHLNHRIPFYRLKEAMRALPELQQPGRTSWSLTDIRACLRLHVWDAQQGRMLSVAEAERAS